MSIRQGSTIIAGSSGSGGTSNYNNLENKPSINGITLEGNKTTEDLNINSLPDQTGNEGKVLITNGTEASWQTLPETGLPLFAHIWSDHLLTNSSYLRADTFSWQDGNIYYTAYNELVNEKNLTTETSTDTINNITITYYRTPKGYKIVLPDMADNLVQLYENTGTAWYYILDTDNTRFKLPRNSRYESGTTTDSAGDFGAESLPNIQGSVKPISFDADGSYSENGAFYTEGESVNGPVSDSSATSVRTLMFSASRSSSTYKDGAKVNPDHVTQFLYFYVGNTIQNETTINIAEITEALNNKADRDFGNITDGTYDFLTTKQVSNCITKIPQDIKLELNNGTLTLKAGSKVYIPNGAGKFKEILINSDISLTDTTNYNNLFVFYIDGRLERILYTQVFSGTDAPSVTNFLYWYDTKNNLIKRTTDGGSNWTSGNISFPLGLFSTNGAAFSSIDQVFNGFGYIGSTTFVLPGVEGLIPNGKNDDGTLNNTKFTTTSVLTRINPNKYVGTFVITLRNNDLLEIGVEAYGYDKDKNINYNTISNEPFVYMNTGTYSQDSTGRITLFNPKTTFQAIDRSDTEWASTASKPSDKYIELTLGASGTQYTAPANGWFLLSKKIGSNSSTASLWAAFTDLSNNLRTEYRSPIGASEAAIASIMIPASKGKSIKLDYTLTGDTVNFRFIYDEGSK